MGRVLPYTWTYLSDASYLHVVSQDPLRVSASDGGHPTLTASEVTFYLQEDATR